MPFNRECKFCCRDIKPTLCITENLKDTEDDDTHDWLETLNDLIRSTIRHEELCKQRLERRKQERESIKTVMDDLLNVLTVKQQEWSKLSKEAKYYKDEVFKFKKRKQKEALKANDGTLQDEGEDFRICTGKRPYVWFAKNSEIDPALAKDEVCKCPETKQGAKQRNKNRNWIEGKCSSCSHILWKIWKYICSQCKSLVCTDCKDQCTKCFNFCCEKCECICGNLKVKLLRA